MATTDSSISILLRKKSTTSSPDSESHSDGTTITASSDSYDDTVLCSVHIPKVVFKVIHRPRGPRGTRLSYPLILWAMYSKLGPHVALSNRSTSLMKRS